MNEPWQRAPAASYEPHEGGWPRDGGWPQAAGPAGAGATTDPPGGGRELRVRWLLAGLLGITGGFLLVSAIPQVATLAVYPDGTGRISLLLLHAVFGATTVTVALLSAPGRKSARVLAAAIVLAAALLVVALLAARLSGGLPVPGVIGGLLTSTRGWLMVAGAAAWLLASGARPLAWLSLVGTLVVAPLETALQVQGVDYGVAEPVLQVVMFLVALLVLAASTPGTGGRRTAAQTGVVPPQEFQP